MLVATPFDDLDEAVRLANDSIYGLVRGIWSNDLRQVMDLVPRIKAGTVWVNAHNLLDQSMPFGGFKQSGIGRRWANAATRRTPRTSRCASPTDIDEIGEPIRSALSPPSAAAFCSTRFACRREYGIFSASRRVPGAPGRA